MSDSSDIIQEFHWVMDILQNIDTGLIVLDLEYNIQLWNRFMQNHSALNASEVIKKNIFELFPELPEAWFRRKVQTITMLQNQAFTTWEQRPYLFRFDNYRPVTGVTEYMYQNCTILPLSDTNGKLKHICVLVYDVTETAANRLQLQAANEQLFTISRTDGLTGLLNRKHWEEALNNEFQRFLRYNHPISLVMFDIDHFKRINDTYGHPAGDEVIRQTSQLLRDNVREIDISGRYGGEEFAVLLIDTGADGAMVVAERLRTQMEQNTTYYEGHVINYTVSLGIAELDSTMTEPTLWIDSADRGLYRAKRAGRNQTVIYSQS